MRRKTKMNATARKFVARTRFTHSGLFEQKPLRKISSLSTVAIQDTTYSIQDTASQAVNLYFSTPSGGQNVLTTNQSSSSTQTILMSCNTSSIAPNTIIRTVLTLCDGSIIKALNGSNNLNISTDPSLKCINDKFNPLCRSDSSSTATLFETLLPLLFLAGCGYGIYKCWRESPQENQPLTPNSIWDEYDRRQRMSRAWDRFVGDHCTIS